MANTLQLGHGTRWDISYQKHVPACHAASITGSRVKVVHTCPRCVELQCGAVVMVETAAGALIEASELTFYDRWVLKEAVMSYRIARDFPCINHDGLQ